MFQGLSRGPACQLSWRPSQSVDPLSCLLLAGVPSLDGLACWMSTLGVEFEVQDPPEARVYLRRMGERALRAAGARIRARGR
jgi:hypothetical protein